MDRTADTLLVGMDFSRGKDVGVLIIGRRKDNGTTDIVNAFQGEDAWDLYMKLVTKKETKHEV